VAVELSLPHSLAALSDRRGFLTTIHCTIDVKGNARQKAQILPGGLFVPANRKRPTIRALSLNIEFLRSPELRRESRHHRTKTHREEGGEFTRHPLETPYD